MTQEDITNHYWFFDLGFEYEGQPVRLHLDCGPGWFPLIDEFCQKLDKLITEKYPELITEFRITQLKEKWGMARIYCNYGNDDIFSLIDEYENLSSHVCEWCGVPGKTRTRHSIMMTICDEDWNNLDLLGR